MIVMPCLLGDTAILLSDRSVHGRSHLEFDRFCEVDTVLCKVSCSCICKIQILTKYLWFSNEYNFLIQISSVCNVCVLCSFLFRQMISHIVSNALRSNVVPSDPPG